MDEIMRMTAGEAPHECQDKQAEKTGADYLEELRALMNEQNWLRQKLELLRQASTDTSVKITSAPGHAKEDKLCTLVAQMDDIERQLQETEAERQVLIREVMKGLERLKRERTRTIVFMHCVLGIPFGIISDRLELSYSFVTKTYRAAIRLLEGDSKDCSSRETKQRLTVQRPSAPPRRYIPAR